MNYSCASLGVVVTLGLAGCNVNNPLFEVSSGSADATSASSGGEGSTSVTPTSEPVTSTTLPGTSGSATDVNGGSSTDPQTGGSTDVGVNTGSSSVGEASSGDTGQPALCGDGVQDEGEECDDGNTNSDDGCSESCMKEGLCGNEVVDPGEQCDDGENNGPNEACLANCVANVCGDGDLGPEEECDLGPDNNNLGSCSAECTKAFCGDGFTNLNETCDAGESNGKVLGGCSADCSANIPKELLLIKMVPGGLLGNFNNNPGVTNADTVCAKKFGGGYKALVVDGVNRIASVTAYMGDGQKDWVLAAHRGYGNANLQPIFITGKERLLGVRFNEPVSLLNPIGVNAPLLAWTGLKKSWQASDANCKQWGSPDANLNGAFGDPDAVDDAFISGGETTCANSLTLYCVQQP